jgi:hypothetical protein
MSDRIHSNGDRYRSTSSLSVEHVNRKNDFLKIFAIKRGEDTLKLCHFYQSINPDFIVFSSLVIYMYMIFHVFIKKVNKKKQEIYVNIKIEIKMNKLFDIE